MVENRLSLLMSRYEQAVGRRDLLQSQLSTKEILLKEQEDHYERCLKARSIIQTVAEQTQKKIEFHISNLVTMALASVFSDPYSFALRFVKRRDKTEADLIFIKDGNEGTPMEVSGGGPLDVASFALRAATWAIKPTRDVLLLDEPFRFVSRDLQMICSDMLKYISEKMGIQLIIISHIPEIMNKADKVFTVSNINGESIISG